MASRKGPWEYPDEETRAKFEEPVTPENCGEKLKLVQKIARMSRREFAKLLGVSEATVRRLEAGTSVPTDEFMDQLYALQVIGLARFQAVSEDDREHASELIGAGGGVATGIGASLGAISASGSVAGLSAAGITSGLATVGGGTMLAGIGVVASVPVLTGLAGYGLVKGIKAICKANDLESEEVDGRWEIRNRYRQVGDK